MTTTHINTHAHSKHTYVHNSRQERLHEILHILSRRTPFQQRSFQRLAYCEFFRVAPLDTDERRNGRQAQILIVSKWMTRILPCSQSTNLTHNQRSALSARKSCNDWECPRAIGTPRLSISANITREQNKNVVPSVLLLRNVGHIGVQSIYTRCTKHAAESFRAHDACFCSVQSITLARLLACSLARLLSYRWCPFRS